MQNELFLSLKKSLRYISQFQSKEHFFDFFFWSRTTPKRHKTQCYRIPCILRLTIKQSVFDPNYLEYPRRTESVQVYHFLNHYSKFTKVTVVLCRLLVRYSRKLVQKRTISYITLVNWKSVSIARKLSTQFDEKNNAWYENQ